MYIEGVLTRTVTRKECSWLSADLPEGKIVFRYLLPTLGKICNTGIAVTDEFGVTPFYEVPEDAVVFGPDRPKFYNGRRFEHHSYNGTRFIAERCDLHGGFDVIVPVYLTQEQLMQDAAEMSAFHWEHIVPRLNGFNGYRVEYRIKKSYKTS